jgi:flagellar protein FlbD
VHRARRAIKWLEGVWPDGKAGREAGVGFMIVLTRLNGQNFVVNAEKIRMVESTPDTVICCETGERLMVKETLEEVVRRAIDYGRLLRRPLTE